jgi:hypothetical protein
MNASRVPIAIALASALAVVLATHGFDEFYGVRAKIVTGLLPATQGAVRLTIDGRGTVARLRPPFALIAEVRNDSADRQPFRITVDGATVCEVAVAAHAKAGWLAAWKERLDCVVTQPWPAGGTHDLVVTSPAAAWSLRYLELSSHDGASSGAHQIFVIPKASTPFSRPSAVEIVVFWMATLGLFLLPVPARLPRLVRILYGVVAAAIGTLVVAIVLAPWVSPFAIVLSWATLVRWAVVLAVPALWRLGAAAVSRLIATRADWAALGRPALVAVLVLLPFVFVMRERLNGTYLGNYSGFIQIGTVFVEQSPYIAHQPDVLRTLVVEKGGYDGQFMYYAAWDPLMRAYHTDPARFEGLMDTPPYRFGRIGYVWLTWLASFGDWHRFPKTMVWLDLVAIFAAALALAVAARDLSVNVLWGLVALLIPAFWQSMETTLPEPVAAALLLLGYLAWRRGQWLWAGGLLAVSLLVRETGAVFVVILTTAMVLRGERRDAVRLGALALAPFVLWHLYVGWVLYPGWGLQGFFFKPELLGVPFAGFVTLWSHVRAGDYEMDLARAAWWLPVLLVAAWIFAVSAVLAKPSALTIAGAVYATIAVSLNYTMVWVHTRNGERVTYEVFVLLALVSAELVSRSRLWRTGILAFWALSGFYVFWIGFDAAFFRETLLSPIW